MTPEAARASLMTPEAARASLMTPKAARASLMTPEAARASLMSRAPTAPGSRQPEEGRPMMERTEILSTMGARGEARRAEGARKLVAPKARGSS